MGYLVSHLLLYILYSYVIEMNLGGGYMKQYEYRVEQIQIELKSVLVADKVNIISKLAKKLNILGKD